MTDKQIIKECSYKGECQMMGCLNDENCFIKQLFEERYRAERELYRKEQECEQQKAELELFKTSNQTTIDQLKAENEELKETIQLQNKMQMEVCKEKNKELDQLKKQLESTKGLVTVGNKQLAEALEKNEELTSKCSQLEEFPRKIRNIILKFAKGDILTFPDLSLEENCIAIQNQCLDPMKQIIQKLDEIQEENCHFDKIKELTKEM